VKLVPDPAASVGGALLGAGASEGVEAGWAAAVLSAVAVLVGEPAAEEAAEEAGAEAAVGDPADEAPGVDPEFADGLALLLHALRPIPVATTAASRADARRTFIFRLPEVTYSYLSSSAATICDGSEPMPAA
jgi:hypothetical protein